jgi:hypothetical protein
MRIKVVTNAQAIGDNGKITIGFSISDFLDWVERPDGRVA